ncbi:DUF3572 family protein [Aurantiacibacter marinus]|uniref:DUF3572 domain-containing protein n=1 Tax=Aurantiacibacter marinus TaxID=874156 RepID=A0A0H0XQL6_9SPHN|nr:DUF3572 family protein [Aurantiacibacter marinus]KLI64873.1 hypothetical protein AAV99_05040 [Aurantiacibacter marinus]
MYKDSSSLALGALAWILADQARAERFLDLTGLTPDGLRGAVGEVSTHRAIFDFLASHEPDLVGAAQALDVSPEILIRAQEELTR